MKQRVILSDTAGLAFLLTFWRMIDINMRSNYLQTWCVWPPLILCIAAPSPSS